MPQEGDRRDQLQVHRQVTRVGLALVINDQGVAPPVSFDRPRTVLLLDELEFGELAFCFGLGEVACCLLLATRLAVELLGLLTGADALARRGTSQGLLGFALLSWQTLLRLLGERRVGKGRPVSFRTAIRLLFFYRHLRFSSLGDRPGCLGR